MIMFYCRHCDHIQSTRSWNTIFFCTNQDLLQR